MYLYAIPFTGPPQYLQYTLIYKYIHNNEFKHNTHFTSNTYKVSICTYG